MASRPTPAAVATWRFGQAAVRAAWPVLRSGGRALDAVEAGARAVEDDPEVDSVGYGGLPNAEGVVELDACIMDGSTLAFGAVAALSGVRNPVSVARHVMEHTPHLMLVGEGAARFALSQGFRRQNLLTAKSRHAYRNRPLRRPSFDGLAVREDWHDTVGVLAIDAEGHLAGACTTSGMPWKLPGRVGDSPLIGCGLYVDDTVGGVVCTGFGEEIMRQTSAAVMIEAMRRGRSPQQACREAAGRMAERCRREGLSAGAGFLALSRDGRVGAYGVHRAYFPYAVIQRGRERVIQASGILPPRAKHVKGGH